ncbi:uncharacterized protein AB675_126 [Cyphellophora attinorum]|uniref:BTB domain-containing protein n=1 Tax=Cyphellophora attinorum TaxID=1664694 RepID=A0A0N1HQK0_9EURO|nr:uncharacterized protein AB675_126 [Phialophora attinorum]KPI37803.1 hypothetical protein AB675_126 [Phialophora attinorum]
MASKPEDDKPTNALVTIWHDNPEQTSDQQARMRTRMQKRFLVQESGYFKAMLDSPFLEASSGIIQLHEDPARGLKLVLDALDTGPSAHQILRSSFVGNGLSDARRISDAEEMYIVADKYDMPSVRKLVVEEFLPQAFNNFCLSHPYSSMSRASLLSTHYSFLNKHFSAMGGYPSDLWPFYVTMVVDYQHTDPEVDLFSHLEDNPKMACYVAKQLSVRLVEMGNVVEELMPWVRRPSTEGSKQNANTRKSIYPEGARKDAYKDFVQVFDSKVSGSHQDG